MLKSFTKTLWVLCSLVVANLAIPTTANAVTLTLSVQMFSNTDMQYRTPIQELNVDIDIDGTEYSYLPSADGCARSSVTARLFWCAFELDVGALDGLITSSTTVTVSPPDDGSSDEDSGCSLSEAEALQTWLNYFFLSWGIMIPIFFAAYAVGVLAKVIRGNK